MKVDARLIGAVGAALGAAGGFVAGMLVRQPEINKLQNQVRSLQKCVDELEALANQQNEEIAQLLAAYKSLKAYQFIQRSALKGEIEESLIFQYATVDYFQLLLECARGEREMDEADIRFYRIFGRIIAEKPLDDQSAEFVNSYVINKHGAEIRHMKTCDPSEALSGVKQFEKPKKQPPFSFGLPFKRADKKEKRESEQQE